MDATQPEGRNIVLVNSDTLRKGEDLIMGCQACSPEDADLPFGYILDRLTGNHSSTVGYIFVEAAAKCPQCQRQINDKTLVEVK